MSDKMDELEGQVELLANVCRELTIAIDGISDRFKLLVENHNELVAATNDNTEWREEMEAGMEALEQELEGNVAILFTPCEDAFRDKKKDH